MKLTISTLLKLIIPPLIYKVGGNLWQFHSVRGLVPFSEIQEIPTLLPPIDVDVWTSDNWIRYQSNTATEEQITNYYSHEAALKLLCAQLGDVDIFDVGGGPAALYPVARAAATKLNYVVLENEKICEIGRKIFPDVHFFSNATEAVVNIKEGGVAICVSALQYCLEWESALDLLISVKPKYVMVGRHYTPPDGKILYAIQTIYAKNGYCGKTHIMFLPKDVLVSGMRVRGYDLLIDIPLQDASSSLRGTDRVKLPVLLTRNFVFVARE